jgi:hypothetical protein
MYLMWLLHPTDSCSGDGCTIPVPLGYKGWSLLHSKRFLLKIKLQPKRHRDADKIIPRAPRGDREAEIYHTHRIGTRRHDYGGWFHFVVKIVSGSDACQQVSATSHGPVWGFDLEKVSAEFEWVLLNKSAYSKSHSMDIPSFKLSLKQQYPGC